MKQRPPWPFFVLAAIIVLGPVYGHFFATGSHEYLGWKMFSRKATDFCAVEYFTVKDGAETAVDRFEVMGQRREPRNGMWRIRDVGGAHRVAKRMCKRLGPRELRSRVTCATKAGWQVADPGEVNRCR